MQANLQAFLVEKLAQVIQQPAAVQQQQVQQQQQHQPDEHQQQQQWLTWQYVSQGQFRQVMYVPHDWKWPKVKVRDSFMLWFYGDKHKKIRPLCKIAASQRFLIPGGKAEWTHHGRVRRVMTWLEDMARADRKIAVEVQISSLSLAQADTLFAYVAPKLYDYCFPGGWGEEKQKNTLATIYLSLVEQAKKQREAGAAAAAPADEPVCSECWKNVYDVDGDGEKAKRPGHDYGHWRRNCTYFPPVHNNNNDLLMEVDDAEDERDEEELVCSECWKNIFDQLEGEKVKRPGHNYAHWRRECTYFPLPQLHMQVQEEEE